MLPLSTVQPVRAVEPAGSVSNGLAVKVPASKLPLLTPVNANADPAIAIDATNARAALTTELLFTRCLLPGAKWERYEGALKTCRRRHLFGPEVGNLRTSSSTDACAVAVPAPILVPRAHETCSAADQPGSGRIRRSGSPHENFQR